MGFLELFLVASMPVLKILLITAIGLFLALDRTDILGANTRKQLNQMAFFVFNPALVGSNLARTITLESIVLLWFMPFNILLTFIIGSAMGWILVKLTNAPQRLKGLIIGCCAAGNLGNMLLIIIPAVCKESGSPFGEPGVCHRYGMAYASLSMAIGAIYLWSYVYNIIRISSKQIVREVTVNGTGKDIDETTKLLEKTPEMVLPVKACVVSEDKVTISLSNRIKQYFCTIQRKINLKSIFTPSSTGALVGFIIGIVPQFRKSLIGASAPLRVIQDSALLLGDAAIPTVTLIMGGNLLKGLKGSGVQLSVIAGIVAVRYIFLPMLGVIIIKGAFRFGFVHSDPLYQFVLLLQYALPPAINIGTMTQLFGIGESECSVIMLWSYALASVSLTLWSTFFMWLVA